MLRKTIPFIFLSALFLGACTTNTNDTVPRNDETPMEDIENRERDWAPRMEDNERRGGTELDGIETESDQNGGIMNNENDNNRLDNQNDPLLDREVDRNSNTNNNR